MYEILGSINEPKDIKNFNIEKLELLADNIRDALLNKVSKTGGHLGPNLAVVETTIALHYVFDSPIDKIIFDVSHQTYPHKMLTGRKDYFIKDELLGKISGFSSPKESKHDIFATGHTSTSISMALGLSKARDLKNETYNIISFIGDGALSGGQALESLNIAGEYDKGLLIIVNDNEISIAENHGGLYKSLRDLRESKGVSKNNIFKVFGLDYYYEENGNDISSMIKILEKLKNVEKPTVLHIHTKKSKGFEFSNDDLEKWHSVEAFDLESKTFYKKEISSFDFKELTRNYILQKAETDKDFIVLTPAMPRSVGLLKEDRKKLKNQYLDVGIAEQSCVSMASGLSKNKAKVLLVTNATFIKRAYDQVFEDLCLNKTPATILLAKSGFEIAKDMTHLGIFTISSFSNIPNLVLLAPTSKTEYLNMLDWSVNQDKHPVMILMPENLNLDRNSDKDFSEINKFKVEEMGEKIAIIGLGDFFKKALDLKFEIEKKLGFKPTLINPRFASGLDKKLLLKLKENHKLVISLENGIVEGGFGQKISKFYSDSSMLVKNYGLYKKFYDRYDINCVLDQIELRNDLIIEKIKNLLSL